MEGTESTKSKESGDFEESSSYMSLSRAFSQSGSLSNTGKQMKHSMALLLTLSRNKMKEHLSHSAEDMTYTASFSVCSYIFRRSVGFVSNSFVSNK